MLFAKIEPLPDFRTASFDGVFAIGVGRLIVDYELSDFAGPIVVTMAFNQPIDRRFDLKQLAPRSVFMGKIE
jgi:hypothetical protein